MMNLEIMYATEELREKMARLRKYENEYKNMQKQCKHDVIVVMHGNRYEDKVDAECPFCRKIFERRKDLANACENGSQVAYVNKYLTYPYNNEIIMNIAQNICKDAIYSKKDASVMAKNIEEEFKFATNNKENDNECN